MKASRSLAILALWAALAACGSVHGHLRSETEIPECARWLEASAMPTEAVRLVPAGEAGGHPIRLAVRSCGRGDRERVDVFLHGVLSDARTWRYVCRGVSDEHDVLLIDLPGCGGSDKPDPADVGDEAYSPSAMARNVLVALRESLKHRVRPPRVTLVGHSLGSAVVLRMLGAEELRAEFADVIERVDRAVLLSPLTFAVEKKDPLFEQIAGLTGVEVTIAEVAGILRSSVADSCWLGVDDPSTLPREEVDRLHEILSDGETRRAAQAMIRTAAPFCADGRCDWTRIEELEDDYANVDVPCLVVCGARDETLPQAMGFRLRQMLPRAWLRLIPRAKHTLPTERPEECVRLVREFGEFGGRGWVAFEGGRGRAPVSSRVGFHRFVPDDGDPAATPASAETAARP